MALPEYKFDHVADMDDSIVTYLKHPLYQKIIAVIAQEVQGVEDTIYSAIVERYIDTAVGKNLDQWGDIVGELRGGLPDGEYRNFIRARIRINVSEGTVGEIITINRYLTGAPIGATLYVPVYPAGYGLVVALPIALSAAAALRLRERIIQATAAGVDLAYITIGPADAFGFLEDPEALGFNDGIWSVSV